MRTRAGAGGEFSQTNMAGQVKEDCFGVKLSLTLGIVNSTDRRGEKRNFLFKEDASGDHLKTIVTIDI